MSLTKEAQHAYLGHVTRRHFLKSAGAGLGAMAFASLGAAGATDLIGSPDPLAPRKPHFAPRAKRVIFLHMAGGPSPLELFDYKPTLARLHGQDCPESLLEGKRFAFIRGIPKMLGPQANFRQHGESGAWISDHLPHLGRVADKIAFLKAMRTDEFNHAPAQLLVHSG